MKYLLGLCLGLLLGAACAGGLIYLNPLIQDSRPVSPGQTGSFTYSLAGSGLLASAQSNLDAVPRVPSTIPTLWEQGIGGMWLQSFVIEDENSAPTAVVTKLIVPSPASNAVNAGLLTDDQWLITLPGRGTLLALGESNVWPLLRDSVVRVDWLARPWAGPKSYSLLRGGAAELIGVSGEFVGQSGALTETLALENYPRTGLAGLAGQLEIALDSAK